MKKYFPLFSITLTLFSITLASSLFSSVLAQTLTVVPVANSTLATDDSALAATVSYITNLNTQAIMLAAKFEVADTKTLGTILEDRKNEWLKLAADKPKLALTLVLPEETRNQLPSELQAKVEQTAQIEGEFSHLHSDNFKTGISHETYYVEERNTGKHYRIYMSSDGLPKTGDLVMISGFTLGTELIANSQDMQVETMGATATTSSRKVAVIMFNWRNDTRTPYSQDEVRNMIFTNRDSAKAYFEEVSFGKLELTGKLRMDGDVFGYYTIPYDNTLSMTCNPYEWSDAADIKAAAANADLSGYDTKIYLFPQLSACDVGFGTIGGNPARIWIGVFPSGDYRGAIIHELGHNLGLHHASVYRCIENSMPVSIGSPQNCTYLEYGDPFSVMGSLNLGLTRHLDNYAKGRTSTNWLVPSENILTIDRNLSPDNIYTITPIESQSNGLQSLRIPKIYSTLGSSPDYYYLEFRRPFGFDNFNVTDPVVNGTSIRIATDYDIGERSLLIDTTPYTDDYLDGPLDAPLLVGETFYDPYEGIKIKTLSVSPSEVKVRAWFETALPPSSIIVVSPSANIQWRADSSQYLEWFSNNIPPNNSITVELLARYNGVPDFSAPGFNSFSTPNDGNELVNLSGVLTSFFYFFHLTTVVDGKVIIGDSQIFQIMPPAPLTVFSPNGGETLKIGEPFNIRWSTNGVPATTTLQLLFKPAATSTTGGIAIMLPDAGSYAGSYSYTLDPQKFQGPGALNTGLYNLTISATINNQLITDTSDAPFTITLGIDQCLNLTGTQTAIPLGYVRSGTVNCVLSAGGGSPGPGPEDGGDDERNIDPSTVDVIQEARAYRERNQLANVLSALMSLLQTLQQLLAR